MNGKQKQREFGRSDTREGLFNRCIECDSEMLVVDSRPNVGSLRRRRECLKKCTPRVTTIEITKADYDGLQQEIRELKDFKNTCERLGLRIAR